MAPKKNVTLVNDGRSSNTIKNTGTVKPIGYDVARAAAAAGSEVNKPGRGTTDATAICPAPPAATPTQTALR